MTTQIKALKIALHIYDIIDCTIKRVLPARCAAQQASRRSEKQQARERVRFSGEKKQAHRDLMMRSDFSFCAGALRNAVPPT
jgi:hypothetical protein